MKKIHSLGHGDVNLQLPYVVSSGTLKEDTEVQNKLSVHQKHGFLRSIGKNLDHDDHLPKVVLSGRTEVEETIGLRYGGKFEPELDVTAAVPEAPSKLKQSLLRIYSHQDRYLQLSDTDEELDEHGDFKQNVPQCNIPSSLTSKAVSNQGVRMSTADSSVKPSAKSRQGGEAKRGSASSRTSVQFKRTEIVHRERPVSGTHFHMLAAKNPALKVLYRYTNYRRRPLSESHKIWLDDKEKIRLKSSQEYVKKLVDDQCAKALKKKETGNEISNQKEKNDSASNGAKRTSVSSVSPKDSSVPKESSVKSKYKNAADFMIKNFPNFGHDDYDDENKCGSAGPMRVAQNNEIDQIMDAFAKLNLQIRENALRKAILTPLDNPEAICLEQSRESSLEGLMLNPIKKNLWRSAKKVKNKKKSRK